MNTLDIIVLAIIGLSGLFAFARGFVREAFSIGAWVASAFIALAAFPYARPIMRGLIANPTVADTVAGVTIFLVSLIVLTLIAGGIAYRVKGSSLSALDRTLGFVFGLVRGAVIACLAYLALGWALPEQDWPDWAKTARTRPFLANGADALRSMVPGETLGRGAAAASEAQRVLDQARDAERVMRALAVPSGGGSSEPKTTAPTSPPPAYKPAERKEMDRLFENTR
jgi:membrane protein required for colicin V production